MGDPYTVGPGALPHHFVQALGIATHVLGAVVADTPADVRAIIWQWPEITVAPPEDFLPRGGLELILHAHDVCAGLGVEFEPPAGGLPPTSSSHPRLAAVAPLERLGRDRRPVERPPARLRPLPLLTRRTLTTPPSDTTLRRHLDVGGDRSLRTRSTPDFDVGSVSSLQIVGVGSAMGRRMVRTVGLVVAVSLAAAACGGGGSDGDEGSASPSDDSQPASVGTDAPTAVEVPPLLEDGVVSDAALAAVLTPDGYAGRRRAAGIRGRALGVADRGAGGGNVRPLAAHRTRRRRHLRPRSRRRRSCVHRGRARRCRVADPDVRPRLPPPPHSSRGCGTASRRRDAPSAGTVAGSVCSWDTWRLATFSKVAVEGSNDDQAGRGLPTARATAWRSAPTSKRPPWRSSTTATSTVSTSSSSQSVAIHPCPAADGTFALEASIDVKASKDGAGQNATMELKINGTVDDNAEIASQNIENHTQWSDYGGGKGQFIDFTFSGANGDSTRHDQPHGWHRDQRVRAALGDDVDLHRDDDRLADDRRGRAGLEVGTLRRVEGHPVGRARRALAVGGRERARRATQQDRRFPHRRQRHGHPLRRRGVGRAERIAHSGRRQLRPTPPPTRWTRRAPWPTSRGRDAASARRASRSRRPSLPPIRSSVASRTGR